MTPADVALGPGADLREADLQGFDLQGADLRCADLQGADLQYADLQGADLQGADLRGAIREETSAKQYTPQFLANVFAAARERAAALANTEGATEW